MLQALWEERVDASRSAAAAERPPERRSEHGPGQAAIVRSAEVSDPNPNPNPNPTVREVSDPNPNPNPNPSPNPNPNPNLNLYPQP